MPLFVKDFLNWFRLKVRLDVYMHKPPLFKDGEIWWCSIGENIGGEISGKGSYFRRPVLVIRKLDKFSFIGIPLTSQPKIGTWYYKLVIKDKENYAVLSQMRNVDYRRMDKILCTITCTDLQSIRDNSANLIRGL